MIVVNFTGGLGNQIFQYAFGRALAKKLNTELYFYKSSFKYNWLRSYEFHHFRIKEYHISRHKLNRILKEKKLSVFKEKEDSFEENLKCLNDNVFYKGAWQSEKFFLSSKSIIISELRNIPIPKGVENDLLKIILKEESICLHIRRGDYVSKKDTQQLYGGICSQEYYQRGVEYIARKIANPVFIIFSDDIKWVKDNFQINHRHYFASDKYKFRHSKLDNYFLYRNIFILLKRLFPDNGFLDFYLMTKCKHFILANSSFSWWGAMLSENSNKIVVAPKKWRNDKLDNRGHVKQSEQIVSTKWIKL